MTMTKDSDHWSHFCNILVWCLHPVFHTQCTQTNKIQLWNKVWAFSATERAFLDRRQPPVFCFQLPADSHNCIIAQTRSSAPSNIWSWHCAVHPYWLTLRYWWSRAETGCNTCVLFMCNFKLKPIVSFRMAFLPWVWWTMWCGLSRTVTPPPTLPLLLRKQAPDVLETFRRPTVTANTWKGLFFCIPREISRIVRTAETKS